MSALMLLIITLPFTSKINIFTNRQQLRFYLSDIIVPAVILAFTAYFSIRGTGRNTKQYFLTEKLFYERKYDEIIALNTKTPSNNRLTSYLTNIALCERGRLDDMLFSIPQSGDNSTLFLKWERVSEILKRGGYFYYTIGLINEAHRWAYEYMVMKGYTPEGLKLLTRTELLYGNYDMASKYISLLKKTFFYRREALHYEKLLFSDSLVSSDEELGPKRKIMTKKDFFISTEDPALNLKNVFSCDTLNRMALQYETAHLLLKKDFLSITGYLPYFMLNGFNEIPVNVQEALAVFGALPGNENVKFSPISNVTSDNFTEFYKTFQQYGNDRKKARTALESQFGNTFWYYVLYY
jgi:hypothetical protein